jgi:hypothetical protein
MLYIYSEHKRLKKWYWINDQVFHLEERVLPFTRKKSRKKDPPKNSGSFLKK